MPQLYLRLLRNDLSRQPGVLIILLFLVGSSAFLLALGVVVIERSSTATTALFDAAKPPHFLQMHQGDYDLNALEHFAADQENLEAWQIHQMVGFDGHDISWERPETHEHGNLAASLIDHLFVMQNSEFDFLVDKDHVVVHPEPGQVYAPRSYQQQLGLQVGDRLTINMGSDEQVFDIAGFVRDAQMASSMASATRFVIAQEDFQVVAAAGGTPESIIEYRLHDPTSTRQFQQDYATNAQLPHNGQAVTGVMIRLVNLISDGLVAIALIFSSAMLMTLALLNVRFVMQSTITDDIRSIGALRAIGIPQRVISSLYLIRYGGLATVGAFVGGLLTMPAMSLLADQASLPFAAAPITGWSWLWPSMSLVLLVALVMGVCLRTLQSVSGVSVVDALVHGTTSRSKPTRHWRQPATPRFRAGISRTHGTGLSRRLARTDLIRERRDWVLIPVIFGISTVVVTLPMSLYLTLDHPKFITYFGAPQADLRADIQMVAAEDGTVEQVKQQLTAELAADKRITSMHAFSVTPVQALGHDGPETLQLEVGNHNDTSLEFIEGSSPGHHEIALSVLNARQLDMHTGDWMQLTLPQGTQQIRMSGIYQDVTNGGFTAKMQGAPATDAERWILYANTTANPLAIAAELDAAHASVSVIPMQQYVAQTLAYVTTSLHTTTVLIVGVGVGATGLLTGLFLGLRIRKDRYKMRVLSTLGFSQSEIIGQLRSKMLPTISLGTFIGVLVTALLGERVLSGVLSMANVGITQLTFLAAPWLTYAVLPGLLVATGMAITYFFSQRLRTATTPSKP